MDWVKNLFNARWWRFQWRYWRSQTPWDTHITPPEVMDFLNRSEPARALDLGCGTGTNAITMARRGWQVTAIDFVPKAIRAARRKAARADLHIDFRIQDVARLDALQGPYDFVLDIGCLFTLDDLRREYYARQLPALVRSGGTYLVYAWLPRSSRGKIQGLDLETVYGLFEPGFESTQTVLGEDSGAPSAWYWFKKR